MKEHYYLDNAATTMPKPESVYLFMDEFFRKFGVNPGRSSYELAVEAELMIEQTRRMLSQFFGYKGNPSRVTFSMNATDSMNTALLGIVQPEDHVVTTRLEHNAVLRPLNHFERDKKVRITRVKSDLNGYIDPSDIKRNLHAKTRVVVINHASNVLGSLQDIAAIGEIVRQTDAILVVDSCQTAGVIPIEMDAWGIDVLVFTGHKGLFGPSGIGGMIVAEDVDIKPTKTGGTGIDSLAPFHPNDYPQRLEAGTISIPGIAGIHAAQKWFANLAESEKTVSATSHENACRASVNHIHAKELKHVGELLDSFNNMPEVTIYGPNSIQQPRVSTLSINVGNLPADRVGEMLDADYRICVRSGLHCAPIVHQDQNTIQKNGMVRLAPGFFTNDEDIFHAIESIREIIESNIT
tara:strand:+ start:386 stop:1609 length:1224 start_codon:yes stop_codon:yes gene_type:complete